MSWKTAFRRKPEDLFAFDGLMFGSVEASYFTPAQQQLIRDFADRRGGGVLFMAGRYSSERWRLCEHSAGRDVAAASARREDLRAQFRRRQR